MIEQKQIQNKCIRFNEEILMLRQELQEVAFLNSLAWSLKVVYFICLILNKIERKAGRGRKGIQKENRIHVQ